MRLLRAFVIILALTVAGWMVFDGSRALLVGDYVTPGDGPHAGQLGPWAYLVSTAGVDPRSTFMKSFFVVFGLSWLLIIVGFIRKRSWSWWGMLAAAVGSLWYLGMGTILSAIQIFVLMVLRARRNHTTDESRGT